MAPRSATAFRRTAETSVTAAVDLDGRGHADITTGIGFLDHLLTALARHARMNVTINAAGDLHVDDHHTAEDVALTLGDAIDKALGERTGFARFGSAYAPLDDALARAVIDFSSRPGCVAELALRRERLGELSCENIQHFLCSLATAMRCTLHVDVLRGDNDHHKAEAAFKALALALRASLTLAADDAAAAIPSTKESL